MNRILVQKSRHALLEAASYGAFLLLIMPATVKGIAATGALFVFGSYFLLTGSLKREAESGMKRCILLFISASILIYLGFHFYNQWLPSSVVHAIAYVLHLPSAVLIVATAAVLGLCACRFVLLSLQFLYKRLTTKEEKQFFSRDLLCCFAAAAITVALSQVMIRVDILSMGIMKYCWGAVVVSVVILFFYCITGGIGVSVSLGTALFMVISTVNVYVYSFRRRMFEPVDIFSFGTALNVVDNYSLFPIPGRILLGWGIWIVLTVLLLAKGLRARYSLPFRKRIAAAACCIIGAISVCLCVSNLEAFHWYNLGAKMNGYILDFTSDIKEAFVTKPEGYGAQSMEILEDRYRQDMETAGSERAPHIIAIMNEAFSDLGVLGEITTNIEVCPYISSIKENAITGYALASVFGGNTANSEFEFLTGNSMAWLSPNSVPYQQYVRPSQYSMVSYLKSQHGYHCVAAHPCDSGNWNRISTYPHLGFDEAFFIEDFPQEDLLREYVSDQEMFEKVISIYESRENEPLFLFGITMQNHGGYVYAGENFEKSVSLNGFENDYPDVEQYLSLLRETDKAVEYLITYFSGIEEDVVIVFFGDHQPSLGDAFYQEIEGSSADSLDAQQLRYKVPFFIWANYDIEEAEVECTSLNYLSSYVYQAAGIPLPPYNRFLSDMESVIPSINGNGFYSTRLQCYLPFDMASEEERKWLLAYEMLQYNNLFDGKNRSDALFLSAEQEK